MRAYIARKHTGPVSKRVGLASLLTMILVSAFALLAVAFSSLASIQLILANDHARQKTAQLQAESGISYWSYLLKHISLPRGARGQALLDGLSRSVSSTLNGSENLRGESVGYDGDRIVVPEIALDGLDRGFDTEISLRADTVLHLHITGRNGSLTRSVDMNVNVLPRGIVCYYQTASRGPARPPTHTADQMLD